MSRTEAPPAVAKLRIVYRSVAKLTPAARNARTHSPAQVRKIVASIREYGWTNPVLIDERGEIIAGHGRILAAGLLEMPKVPCIVLSGLTEAQKRTYAIADNRLALDAGWDREILALELRELQADGVDLKSTGFYHNEIHGLVIEPAEVEPTPVATDAAATFGGATSLTRSSVPLR